MNFIKNNLYLQAATIMLSLFLLGCNGGKSAQDVFGVSTSPDVNINLMAVNPSNKFLFTGESVQFSATGGAAPYQYSLSSGVGSVTPTGFYTAPNFTGTAVVKAVDSTGKDAFATVSISVPIALSPTSSVVGEGDTISFVASGGLPPFGFRIVAGLGAINSTTGLYDAAGVVNGSAVIEVKDSSDNTAYASVTINPALIVVPQIQTVGFSEQITFTTSGGNAPYTYVILSGNGVINSSSGVFVAANSVGTTIIRVTDSSSNTVDSVVTVIDKPQIDRPQEKMALSSSITFTATNGAPPYTFSISSGLGTIDSSTGIYTAAANTGVATIQVTDFNGSTDSTTVEVFRPRFVAMGYFHSCAVDFSNMTESVTKCWGRKSLDTSNRALTGEDKDHLLLDEPDEVVDYLKSVNLGTGIVARAVKNDYYATCAITTNNKIKCFGYNNNGNLGLGDRNNRGATIDEMGDNLPFVELGLGRTVHPTIAPEDVLSMRYGTACVILDNNDLRCWGYGGYGKLGQGGTFDVADAATERGNTFPVVDLGSADVVKVQTGQYHTCAILSNGDLKCWGRGNYGQTGAQNNGVTGTNSGNKPVNVNPVNLGSGRSSIDLCTGSNHTCAVLDNGDVKCFGRNNRGQLGQERTGDIGTGSSSMGDNLPITDLGFGRTATKIACSLESTCAILDNGKVKCWGYNASGELGVGNTTQKGLLIGDMGDSLDSVILGTGLSATKIIAGRFQFCAKLNTGDYKCWGDNPNATLGQGHKLDIGKSVLSMGNNLSPINISSTNNITQMSVDAQTACAVLDNGHLKCWGVDYYGSRGLADRVTGDRPEDMGANLASFNLGSEPNIVQIKSSVYSTCALNSAGRLFCFGEGGEGALAIGSSSSRGDKSSEMGDNIKYIDFGAVSTVKDFSVGYRGGCAILTNDVVKCWGRNDRGQLALGNNTDRGTNSAHLGSGFTTTDLGNLSTPVQIVAGYEHRCARFSNGRVKCWGTNNNAQLGLGLSTGTVIGNNTNETGNNLNFLNLGSGINATNICAGLNHNCAQFDNNQVKCWGSRQSTGTGAPNNVGDSSSEMGDALEFLNFGTGRSVKKLACGGNHSCAILDNNDLKCWGNGASGQLGIGSTATIGDSVGEMGDSHKAVNLGTNRYAIDVFTSYYQTCAVLDNNEIKCFGRNLNGQLGQGHLTNIGTIDVTMGDNLKSVEIK